MLVVSDSTPLISLMKAGQLSVLEKLFGRVIIPKAVYEELTSNDRFIEEGDLIRDSAFLEVVTVSDTEAISILQRTTGLDLGESEAIVYADGNNADFILMDEAAGRKVANDKGLNIMGSLGILVQAFKDGILSEREIIDSLEKMRQANRHIHSKLIQDVLKIIREL